MYMADAALGMGAAFGVGGGERGRMIVSEEWQIWIF